MTASSYGLRGMEEYFVSDDKDIKSRMREIYNETATITQSRWLQQSIDARYYAGDQSLWGEMYSQLPAFQRKQFNFNKVRRIINMVDGYQRRNRKTLNVIPIENSDEQTANQRSKALAWANGRINAYNAVSDAFLGSLITGMNLINCWVDYREDPFSGDLRIDNLGYNGYLIDPYFKKIDLSDCNYIWIRKFLSNERIASLMPERASEIMAMNAQNAKDGYFNFLPENYNVYQKNLLPYDEFYYLDYRDVTLLVDRKNELSLEWEGPKENLKLYLKTFPQLSREKIKKQTCKLAIAVNNIVMYHGKNPYKIDRYPFVPVIAYYQPELPYYEWRIQGMVRGLRDPQFLLNRRQQILLDVLESQVNSGLKAMENSLVASEDAYKAGQGQVFWIKEDAKYGMDSIQKVPPANVSPAFMEVINLLNKDMSDISGVNEELLGSAEDDKAGILSMLRQGAGLTTLQILFDNLDLSMKCLGNLEMELITANFTEAKIARIIEEEPTPRFFDKSFEKYDCMVVEGPNTPTQKMTAFKQKLYLKEIGIPIPTEDLLEDSIFQNKKETMEKIIAQEEQQAKMQQMQIQLQMQELQSRTNLANARADADRGLGVERATRVQENLELAVERRAKAIEDISDSQLNKIKAVKELQGMNLDQIMKGLQILKSIQNETEGEEKEIEKEETREAPMQMQQSGGF